MAPKLSNQQVCGLFDFLGFHQKVSSLESWRFARVKAEELKVTWNSYRQMRREKVTPKCLGNLRSKNDSDISPWTAKEDHALTQLIRDSDASKERAFARSNEHWSKLVSDLTTLQDTRPKILDECRAFCDRKVAIAIKEKQAKANRNLRVLINASRWDKATRPGDVVDLTGNKTTKIERQLLSLGFKFSTGLNDRTPLDIATAVNKFRHTYRDDHSVPDITFIRASVIPYLSTD